ncbi:MAG: hypothetical protein AB7W47_07830 [Calditrichaceae bacterium]
MTNLSKKTLEIIEKNKINPYPKSYFLLRRSVIWTLFFISVLLGSVASGIAIYQLKQTEWELLHYFSHDVYRYIFIAVPYFWIFFLSGFTGFIYYYFRRMGKGYRYNSILVILSSIILSVTGGLILNRSVIPFRLESLMEQNFTFYESSEERKQEVWSSPGDGLLAGIIEKNISKEQIMLTDFHGATWSIDISVALFRGKLIPAEGLKVKLIGRQTGNQQFKAVEVRLWDGQDKRNRILR